MRASARALVLRLRACPAPRAACIRIPALNTTAKAAGLSAHLNQLEQASLIRLSAAAPDLEYIFRHALIQDSAYQTLVRADRRRVHAAAGAVLEALLAAAVAGGEPPPGLALQLARHFDEAGDHPRALR